MLTTPIAAPRSASGVRASASMKTAGVASATPNASTAAPATRPGTDGHAAISASPAAIVPSANRTARAAPSRSGSRAPALRTTTTIAAKPNSTPPAPDRPRSSA